MLLKQLVRWLLSPKEVLQWTCSVLGPEHTGHFVQPLVAAHCGGDIYSRRKPLFSSFGEHTAVCGSSVRQAVARPRHRQSVCIHNIHVAATCRPSVLGSATMRGHMWLNKVASVLGPLTEKAKSLWCFGSLKSYSFLRKFCRNCCLIIALNCDVISACNGSYNLLWLYAIYIHRGFCRQPFVHRAVYYMNEVNFL